MLVLSHRELAPDRRSVGTVRPTYLATTRWIQGDGLKSWNKEEGSVRQVNDSFVEGCFLSVWKTGNGFATTLRTARIWRNEGI